MVTTTLQVALLGLLQVASSRTVPVATRSWARKVQAAGAPAMPTSTLVSDFKKNNVSAQWAPGHPMQWGTEEKKFEDPPFTDPNVYTNLVGAVSEDEKFLAMVNLTNTKIVDFDTGAIVSLPTEDYKGDTERAIFLSAPNGEYDVLISASNYTARNEKVIQIHLSADGKPTNQTNYYGGRLSSFDALPFNKRRFLTSPMTGSPGTGNVYAYDLDNPTSNLTLTGATDWSVSAAFSPDGKYISTASWDQTARLYDATTGEVIHTFGPTGGQNWLTRFSPDGKYVMVTNGGRTPNVRIWSLDNLLAEPWVISDFKDWVRHAEFSPDGEYLAAGEYGLLLVYRVSDKAVVQRWEMEDRNTFETHEISWQEGRKRLVYRTTGGLEMYDFETNLKYRWGPGDLDHYAYGSPVGSTFVLKKKGFIGGTESDQIIRFWKYPA